MEINQEKLENMDLEANQQEKETKAEQQEVFNKEAALGNNQSIGRLTS
jgi:hypothetical protein